MCRHSPMGQALVNGAKQDYLSLYNRACHYGDGVFETLAVHDGDALAWDAHITRLQAACQRLGLVFPGEAVLARETRRLCADRDLAVLKVIISRGEGGRGYTPADNTSPTRILMCYPWPEYPSDYARNGIAAGICGLRLSRNPVLAGIKHLNRLEQVLLRREIAGKYPEALVMDTEDRVIEGTMSNLFFVREGQLYTPELSQAGVEGVVRGRISELCTLYGLSLDCGSFAMQEVLDAEELFFCNSIAGIWPVTRIEDRTYAIGETTRRLQRVLHDNGIIVA